ncbi:hypothetical protein B0H13DRAFT_2326104 [Mycena leptocephala]|nr:hypothetical protein B0H13DRAFT_2326104 [Mycena leptocephala]
MTTHQNPVRVMGIFKCPAAMSMETFTQKLEALIDAIIPLPSSENISKYDLCVPNRALDAHLERLGMPSSLGTIVVTAEFQTVEKMDAVLFDPEVNRLVEGAKADMSWHLESCTFAYDKISKISN